MDEPRTFRSRIAQASLDLYRRLGKFQIGFDSCEEAAAMKLTYEDLDCEVEMHAPFRDMEVTCADPPKAHKEPA